jgi:tetratricopeptide (TPR) repeat protein
MLSARGPTTGRPLRKPTRLLGIRMQRFQGLTAFVAISCFVISGCTQVSTGEHLQNGDRLAASNNNAAAIIEYRAAVQKDERNGTARLKLGRAYAKDQNWSRAADELARAADLLPGDDSAQIDTARALLKLGRFEDARSRAEAVLKRNPQNVDAHVLRAGAAAGLRDTDGALNSLTEAVEADPARSLSYVDLGLLQVLRVTGPRPRPPSSRRWSWDQRQYQHTWRWPTSIYPPIDRQMGKRSFRRSSPWSPRTFKRM